MQELNENEYWDWIKRNYKALKEGLKENPNLKGQIMLLSSTPENGNDPNWIKQLYLETEKAKVKHVKQIEVKKSIKERQDFDIIKTKLQLPKSMTYDQWMQKEIDKRKQFLDSKKQMQVYRKNQAAVRRNNMREERLARMKKIIIKPTKYKDLVKAAAINGLINYDCSYELVMGFKESKHLWSIE